MGSRRILKNSISNPEEDALSAAACVLGKESWNRDTRDCGVDLTPSQASEVLQRRRWRDRKYRTIKSRALGWRDR